MKKKDSKINKEHTRAAVSRFWTYTKGYRLLTFLCPVMILADVIIELQIPKEMGEVINLIYKANNPEYTGNFTAELTKQLFVVLGLCAVTLIIGYIASRCSAISSMGFGANLRRKHRQAQNFLTYHKNDK